MYDVYLTATLGDGTYKLLFVDQCLTERKDYIQICDYNTLDRLLHSKDLVFHNVKCDSAHNLLSSNIRDNSETAVKESLHILKPEYTLWDLLEVLISCKASFIYRGVEYQFRDLVFDISRDLIKLQPHEGSNVSAILWSIASSSINSPALTVSCPAKGVSTDFFEHFDGVWNIIPSASTIRFSLRMRHCKYAWSFVHSMLRFNAEELAYLAEAYLCTFSYLLGTEIGLYFMRAINGINTAGTDRYSSYFDLLASTAVFRFDVEFPSVAKVIAQLSKNPLYVYEALKPKLHSTQESVVFLEEYCGECGSYYDALFKGVTTQITSDKSIADYEYACSQTLHDSLQRLIIGIYKYRLALMSTPMLYMPHALSLSGGALLVERNS